MLGWFKKPPPDHFALRDDIEDECQELSKRATKPIVCWESAPVKGDNDA